MKKYIVLSLIALAALQSWACGGWIRPNYYMFSVFNRDLMENPFSSSVEKYWVDYTGSEDARWACDILSSVKPDEFDKTDNIIVATARKRNDTETLNYLRLLVKYLNNDGSQFNRWNYPTKEQLAQQKSAVIEVQKKAAAYRGTKYRNQYSLLLMRCNMTAGNQNDNIAYWKNTASKLKESVYKNWMKDIYAGALYNTGKKDEACKIYAELGDMTSIKYCVRKKRNLKGLKEEYAADPNSPTLIFLVQDFVNNTQETLDNGSDPEVMRYVEATGIYQNDIDGFIEFAGQVLKEGRTKSPSMWEAARGWVNYMIGNQDDAINQLTNAKTLAGTQRMKDNARACLMLASIKSAQPTDEFFNYMLGEYKWLDKVAGVNGGVTLENRVQSETFATDPHYADVFERVTYDALVPQLEDWGMRNTAIAVLGMAKDRGVSLGEYSHEIDSLSSSELDHYYHYLNSDNHNAFEKWAIGENKFDETNFNDLMGTKLLREGEFNAAISYLEKVPLSYISDQGISYYMARKDYNQEIWLKRQFLSFLKEEKTPVESNAKLQYCRDMVALDNKINNATGEEKNLLLYKKACLLYQASYKGDCWYLAHYSQGVYDVQKSNEYDFINSSRILLGTVQRNTTDVDLAFKCMFAQTFITAETTGYCIMSDYDWRNNTTNYSLDTAMPHYRAMTRLTAYKNENAGINAPYYSKCDVVKKFNKLNN